MTTDAEAVHAHYGTTAPPQSVEWTAPCPRCARPATWRIRYPGTEGSMDRPLGPHTVTCPACDTQVAVWTDPPQPSPVRYVAELRRMTEREGAAS